MSGKFTGHGSYYKYLGEKDTSKNLKNLTVGNSYHLVGGNGLGGFLFDDLGKTTGVKWEYIKFDGNR